MSVYVDNARLAFKNMTMCHMIANTPDELHAMADAIGMRREWFQTPPKASFWHYDVAQGKRVLAVKLGAIECDARTFVGHLRRIRESKAFGDLVAINQAARG